MLWKWHCTLEGKKVEATHCPFWALERNWLAVSLSTKQGEQGYKCDSRLGHPEQGEQGYKRLEPQPPRARRARVRETWASATPSKESKGTSVTRASAKASWVSSPGFLLCIFMTLKMNKRYWKKWLVWISWASCFFDNLVPPSSLDFLQNNFSQVTWVPTMAHSTQILLLRAGESRVPWEAHAGQGFSPGASGQRDSFPAPASLQSCSELASFPAVSSELAWAKRRTGPPSCGGSAFFEVVAGPHGWVLSSWLQFVCLQGCQQPPV